MKIGLFHAFFLIFVWCPNLPSDVCSLIGKVYNDIGLLYNGLKSYENAAECFELAIPLMRTEHSDKNLEAVLQQNLGAVYNQLKQFNKAMECHRQAIYLHGTKDILCDIGCI